MFALLHVEHLTHIDLLTWQFDPPVILGLIAASGLYIWATSPSERGRYPNSAPVPTIQIISFFAGLLAFAVALLSPLEPLSDSFLFSGHMVQHILITIVGPPLMMLGIPQWLYEAIARGAGRLWDVWLFITRPLLAFAIMHLTFTFVHFPAFYNLALRNENVHILEHILLWATAFIGWWCIVAPSRELGAISRPLKGLYLMASTIPGQVVGALITFSGSILYDEYAHANRVWGLSVEADQQIGGLLMWVGVGTFFLVVALAILGAWANDQTSADRRRMDAATKARRQSAS